MQLNQAIPWQRLTRKQVKYHRGKAKEERPPRDPAVVLKMLPAANSCSLSEPQAEGQSSSTWLPSDSWAWWRMSRRWIIRP